MGRATVARPDQAPSAAWIGALAHKVVVTVPPSTNTSARLLTRPSRTAGSDVRPAQARGRGSPRVVEGGDGGGLRLQALDQGLGALLHGQEARLRARVRPSGPACGLDAQMDGGGGLDQDEQGGQGGERTA